MAAWVSFSDWNGNGSPFGANAHYVGLANYRHLLTEPGLDQNNFGTALRNNVYYVLLVVPIQTAVALFLAVLVNRRLRGVGFFRTAFYFPSVTSSVAITVLFLFLFSPDRRDQQAPVVLRCERAAVVLRPARALPRHPRPARHPPVGLALEPVLPRRQLLGLAVRPERRDVRLHHHGRVHDVGDVHAALPRGPPEHRRVDQRGGCARRRERVAQVPLHHGADDPPDALHGRDAWPDRDLADLRPDLRRNERQPVEHDVDAGVPVVQRLVQQQQLGRRRRDRLHPLRDHRLLHARDAAPHPQPGPRAATAPLRADAGSRQPGCVACRSAAPRARREQQRPGTERRERGAAAPSRDA